LVNFYTALMVLGIGWNFGLVGGTYMLQSAVSEEEGPLLQGANDTILAISSSAATFLSGRCLRG